MKKNMKLFIPLGIIIFFSLISLYRYNTNSFIKQIIWISLGFVILLFRKKINIKKLFNLSFYLYLLNVFLLILVLFVGKEINGSKAWFDFKFFSFQPSELMKLTLMLYLTRFFKENKKLTVLKSIIIFLIPSILVYLEPDTGAIIMYLIIYFSCLFITLKNKKILIIFLMGGITLSLLFFCLYKTNLDFLIKIFGTSLFYRIDRIINFKNNYQLQNALINISTSSWLGRGTNKAIYVPESVTDFMFTYVITYNGLLVGLIILLLYFIINIFLINLIDLQKKDNVFIFSFYWLFIFQQIQNIFMNIGILPIMGIPLPFLSYGGSNTIIYFIFLAIILQIKTR